MKLILITEILRSLTRNELAIFYAEKALKLAHESEDLRNQINCLSRLKQLYANQGKPDKVLESHSEILQLLPIFDKSEKIFLEEQKFYAQVVYSLDLNKEVLRKLQASYNLIGELYDENLPFRNKITFWRIELYTLEILGQFQMVYQKSLLHLRMLKRMKKGRIVWILDFYIQFNYACRALGKKSKDLNKVAQYLSENLRAQSPNLLIFLLVQCQFYLQFRDLENGYRVFIEATQATVYHRISVVERENWILLEHVFHYLSTSKHSKAIDDIQPPTPFHEISLLRKDSRGFQVCVSILEMSLALLKGEDYRTEQLLDKIHNDYYAFIRESDTERTIHFYKLMRKRLQKRPEEFHNDPKVQAEIEEMKKSPRTMKTLEGWEIIPYDLVFEWDRENHLSKTTQL